MAAYLQRVDGRQSRWTAAAAALVVFAAQIKRARGDEIVISGTHGFDTGAAWFSFAVQAQRMGYATHAMAGSLNDKLRGDLHVPDDIHIHAVVAVGRQADAESLPDDLRGREVPSDRRKLSREPGAWEFLRQAIGRWAGGGEAAEHQPGCWFVAADHP